MEVKKIFANELLQRTIKELIKMRNDIRKSLFDFKVKNSMRGLKQTHLISIAKKNIARINTILKFKLIKKDGNNMK